MLVAHGCQCRQGRQRLTEFTAALRRLVDGAALERTELEAALTDLLEGRVSDVAAAAWLTAWRCRGETPALLAAARAVLLRLAIPWPAGEAPQATLDTCGTGGDGQGTFNISTAAALVVAACGVPVVKHGNRGFSSPSGSADVLEALGVPVDLSPTATARCLMKTGFAFCLASQWHPAVGRLSPIRRALGFRTLFNLVGPLVNPARPRWQVVGVAQEQHLDLIAKCLRETGQTAFVVHGAAGLDEIALNGATQVRHVQGGCITALTWTAEDFGLPAVAANDVQASSVTASAQLVEEALRDPTSPASALVQANAAAALLLCGRADRLDAGVALARTQIARGAAWDLVEQLRRVSA